MRAKFNSRKQGENEIAHDYQTQYHVCMDYTASLYVSIAQFIVGWWFIL